MLYTYPQQIKKILRIALPSGANSFLDMLILTIALKFMAEFSPNHIVGLSIGIQYIMLFYSINAIFYIGTNAQISRFFGARDSKSASSAFYSIVIFCLMCAAPLAFVSYILIDTYLAWMDLKEEALTLCYEFLVVAIFSLPGTILKNIIVSAFTATGNTLIVFNFRFWTTILCVILNVVLIFKFSFLGIEIGFGLGIIGAGIANVVISYLELLILWIIAVKKGDFFMGEFKLNRIYIFKALKIGLPSGVERLCTLGAFVLTSKFIASFGSIALAGSQIGGRIETFGFMFVFGFMVAASVLTGQNLGAKRIDLALSFNRTILILSSVIMGVLGFLMAIFARPLSALFLDDLAVIDISVMYLVAVGASQIPLVWIFVLDGIMRGAGATKISLFINLCSIWIFRIIPMWAVVEFGLELFWIFVLIFSETYLRAMFFYAAYRHGSWKRI